MTFPIKATNGRRPPPKLASDAIRQRIAVLAEGGASLGQIQAHLAMPRPDGFGLEVSRVSIYRRLQAAGIKLKNQSISARTPVPTIAPEALALARRPVSPEDLAKHKERKRGHSESWLAQFGREINGLKASGYTYRGIWDLLALRYPVVPQFAAPLSTKQKTDRLAVFVCRQRRKRGTRPTTRPDRDLATDMQTDSAHPVMAPSRLRQGDVATTPEPRTRASLPAQGVNVRERQQALLAEGATLRATPEEVNAARRRSSTVSRT